MKKMLAASLATALVSLTALSGSAFAAPAADERLIYASFGVGGVDGSQESYRRDGSQLSIGYSLGYRFTSNYGAELYARSLSFKPWGSNGSYAYPDTHVGIAAVGRYPVAQMLSLTGRVGLGRTKMTRDNGSNPADKTTVTAGVGAAIEFGPHLALTAGYERYSGINSGLWLLSWQLAF